MSSVAPERAGRELTRGSDTFQARLFTEDIVFASNDPGVLGLISETPDAQDELDDDEDILEEGQVRVCWLTGEEAVEEGANLEVVDRALMHGDIVTWASNPLGQSGHVVGVNLVVDVESSDKVRFNDVPSSSLAHIRPLRQGMYVVHGTWLGRVHDVLDNVHVQFDDGSICKVTHATTDVLYFKDEKDEIFLDEDQSPFYPGQQVHAESTMVFRHATWLHGSFKGKLEGCVVHVEPAEVEVDWLAACKFGDQDGDEPPETVHPRDLHLFCHFSYTCWQLGDRALLAPGVTLADLAPKAALESESRAGEEAPTALAARMSAASGATSGTGGGSAVPCGARKHDPTLPERGCSDHTGSAGTRTPTFSMPPRGRRRRTQGAAKKREGRKAVPVADVVQIVKTRTVVDVQWQDATITRGVDAKLLYPVTHFGDHELWPDTFVEEVVDDDYDAAADTEKRTGLVLKVDPVARMVSVAWLARLQDGRLEPLSDKCVREQVSVYEVREHADYLYRLGDVVLRLAESEDAQQPHASSTLPSAGAFGQSDQQHQVTSAGSSGADTDALGWVGEIIGLKDGMLHICWANREQSMAAPETVWVVARDDDMEGDSLDDGGSESSWETLDGEDPDEETAPAAPELAEHAAVSLRWQIEEAIEAEAELLNRETDGIENDPREMTDVAAQPAARTQAAAQNEPVDEGGLSVSGSHLPTSEIAAGLAHALGGSEPPDHPAAASGSGETSTSRDKAGVKILAAMQKSWNAPSGLGRMLNSILSSGGRELPDGLAVQGMAEGGSQGSAPGGSSLSNAKGDQDGAGQEAGEEREAEFARYGEVESFTMHAYIKYPLQPTNARQWQKRVLKDLKTLSRNLPDTIWARTDASQMGLLRSAILGAKGTPYHDNLFFFDIYLPPSYPDTPPEVYYFSNGRRLNPNLYENGKVCLSLLNTWNGREDEMWNPETSTILQVLVSIQGLVLVPKPYYNEAGYERQVGTPEGEHNAALYNENAFLLSCRSMMDIVRAPPQHFEPLVRQHFRKAAPTILAKIDEYLEGRPVGQVAGPCCEGSNQGSSSCLDEFEMPSSEGFRRILARVRPKLQESFATLS